MARYKERKPTPRWPSERQQPSAGSRMKACRGRSPRLPGRARPLQSALRRGEVDGSGQKAGCPEELVPETAGAAWAQEAGLAEAWASTSPPEAPRGTCHFAVRDETRTPCSPCEQGWAGRVIAFSRVLLLLPRGRGSPGLAPAEPPAVLSKGKAATDEGRRAREPLVQVLRAPARGRRVPASRPDRRGVCWGWAGRAGSGRPPSLLCSAVVAFSS